MPDYDNMSIQDMLRALTGGAGSNTRAPSGLMSDQEMMQMQKMAPPTSSFSPEMARRYMDQMPPPNTGGLTQAEMEMMQRMAPPISTPPMADIEMANRRFMQQMGLAPPLYSRGFGGPGAP